MRVGNGIGKGTSGMNKLSSALIRRHVDLGNTLLSSSRVKT